MTPQDLIRLSAVAKSLLSFFWSKSSKFAWENSARNMPLLPERPLELSWPRYAEMIFSKTCSVSARLCISMNTFDLTRFPRSACTKGEEQWMPREASYCLAIVDKSMRFLPGIAVSRISAILENAPLTTTSSYVKKGGRRYPVELGGKYSPIQRIIFPRTETWHAQSKLPLTSLPWMPCC